MLLGGRVVGLLRAGEEGGQFLGRTVEIELRLRRSEVRRVSGLSLRDQTRIHRGRVFHGQGLFGGVRRRRQQELKREYWQLMLLL